MFMVTLLIKLFDRGDSRAKDNPEMNHVAGQLSGNPFLVKPEMQRLIPQARMMPPPILTESRFMICELTSIRA